MQRTGSPGDASGRGFSAASSPKGKDNEGAGVGKASSRGDERSAGGSDAPADNVNPPLPPKNYGLYTGSIHDDKARFDELQRGKLDDQVKRAIDDPNIIQRNPNGDKARFRGNSGNFQHPRFRYGDNSEGDGSGPGQPGDGPGQPGQPGQGPGEPGQDPADMSMGPSFSWEDIMKSFAKQLELPPLKPKGAEELQDIKLRVKAHAPVGSVLQARESFRRALRREFAVNSDWKPGDDLRFPGDVRRYRSFSEEPKPKAAASLILMLDVSGSMGDAQRELARRQAFWIKSWLEYNFDTVQLHFVIHDTEGVEVDAEQFFRIEKSGGTQISAGYEKVNEIIDTHCEGRNVFFVQYSDGDDWRSEESIEMLRKTLLPKIDHFCYAQTNSPYGSGEFLDEVAQVSRDGFEDKVFYDELDQPADITRTLKKFFGKKDKAA